MKAVARRRSGYLHEVDVNGHLVVVDEPEDSGGTDKGPSPTDLLAASLASCTAITIAMYVDRKGWSIEGMEVSVESPGTPKSGEAASFVVTLALPEDLDAEQIERIRTIAAKCPVHRTLAGDVEIDIRDEVLGA
jgi:putative redox protein